MDARSTSPLRPSLLAAALLAAVLGACKGARTAESTAPAMSDQVHGRGTPGFFWMPPLAPATAYGAAFKDGLAPVVTVEALPLGSRPPVATFTTTSGGGGAVVRSDLTQYIVNWDTKLSDLDPAVTYRIRVVLENFELGFADLDVVASGSELKMVQTNEFVPLLDGRTLPIKFRIEPDALRCVGVYCTALDACHVAGKCDPFTGTCSNPNAQDGTGCDDANACTRRDTCLTGACVGADPVLCVALDTCHDAGTCAPATGVCTEPVKPDGSACDDGDACTQVDSCDDGACVGADPVVCTARDACHMAGICDAASGQCSDPAAADGTPCDDLSVCTKRDACVDGVCTGMQISCSDGDPCTLDGCDAVVGCVHVGQAYAAPSCAEPNPYAGVSIGEVKLLGGPFHARQEVAVSAQFDSDVAHTAFRVDVFLVPASGPEAGARGYTIAGTAVALKPGTQTLQLAGELPEALAPGKYLLFARQYPTGSPVGGGTVALGAAPPPLPVLDLRAFFQAPEDAVLHVDPESTWRSGETVQPQRPFSGTVEVVARNAEAHDVPLTSYLEWNGLSFPLRAWDAELGQWVSTLVLRDRQEQGVTVGLRPHVARAVYLQLALAETDAEVIRAATSTVGEGTVRIILNEGATVLEEACAPGAANCTHALGVAVLLRVAPPLPGALATFGTLDASGTRTLAQRSLVGALGFNAPAPNAAAVAGRSYVAFPQNRFFGAGVQADAWSTLTDNGLSSFVRVAYPVKVWDTTLHLLRLRVDATANRNQDPVVTYHVGSAVCAEGPADSLWCTSALRDLLFEGADLKGNESTPALGYGTVALQQPSALGKWRYSQTYVIGPIPVTLATGLDFSDVTLGAGAEVRTAVTAGTEPGRSIAIHAAPEANVKAFVDLLVGLDVLDFGVRGTLNLLGGRVTVDGGGAFTLTSHGGSSRVDYVNPVNVGAQLTPALLTLDGSVALVARYPWLAWPEIVEIRESTETIASWPGLSFSPGAQSSYVPAAPRHVLDCYASQAQACAGRCGQLPPDDCGNTPTPCYDAASGKECASGYVCNSTYCQRDCTGATFYVDRDGDGYGSEKVTRNGVLSGSVCLPPSETPPLVGVGGDCLDDPANPRARSVNPGATEVVNGMDENCNEQCDDGLYAAGPTYGAGFREICPQPGITSANLPDCANNLLTWGLAGDAAAWPMTFLTYKLPVDGVTRFANIGASYFPLIACQNSAYIYIERNPVMCDGAPNTAHGTVISQPAGYGDFGHPILWASQLGSSYFRTAADCYYFDASGREQAQIQLAPAEDPGYFEPSRIKPCYGSGWLRRFDHTMYFPTITCWGEPNGTPPPVLRYP